MKILTIVVVEEEAPTWPAIFDVVVVKKSVPKIFSTCFLEVACRLDAVEFIGDRVDSMCIPMDLGLGECHKALPFVVVVQDVHQAINNNNPKQKQHQQVLCIWSSYCHLF